jgi:hypothetical protein
LFIKFIMLLLAGVALYEILGKKSVNDFLSKITINILVITLFFILTLMIYYYLKYSKSEKQILKIMIGTAKFCLIVQFVMFEMFVLIGVEENKKIAGYVYYILVYSLLYLLLYCEDKMVNGKKKEASGKIDGELFGIREKQAEVLRELIKEEKENSMILIDGEWGIGKTFFVKKALKKENANLKEIFIDVMMFNGRKALNEEFFKSIEKILEENGIMRKSAENLKNQINKISETDNKFINIVIEMIKRETIDKTFIDGKESLGEAIKKLGKKIVVVIDNIERILKHDDIVEILGFLHEMQSIDGIAVIVCADKEKLKAIISKENGEKHEEYIEKFFIQKIEMTKIEPIEIIEHIGKREEYKEYKDILIKVVKEINKDSDEKIKFFEKLNSEDTNNEKKTEISKAIEKFEELKYRLMNPRRMEQILEEIKNSNKDCENIFLNNIENKIVKEERYIEIIIRTMIAKIVFPIQYKLIDRQRNYDGIFNNKESNSQEIETFKILFLCKKEIEKTAYLRIIDKTETEKVIKFVEQLKKNSKVNIDEILENIDLLKFYYNYLDSEDIYINIYGKMRERLMDKTENILNIVEIIKNIEILELEKRYCIENQIAIKNSIFSILEMNFINSEYKKDRFITIDIRKNIKEIYKSEIELLVNQIYKGSMRKDELLSMIIKDLFKEIIRSTNQDLYKNVFDSEEEKYIAKIREYILQEINKMDNIIQIIKNELYERIRDLLDILEILENILEEKEEKTVTKTYSLNFENKSHTEQLEMIEEMERKKIELNIEEQEKYIKQPLKIKAFNIATEIKNNKKIKE